MKHILFIAGWCDPFGDFIKEHAYAIARYNKVSYVFIDFVKSHKHWPFKSTMTFKAMQGVEMYFIEIHSPVRRFGIFEWLNTRAYRKAIRAIESKQRIDVCHINVRTNITELVPSLPEIQKLPIVLTEHNTYYHYGIYQKYTGDALKHEIERIRNWLNLPALKYIMPVSHELANVLKQTWAIEERRIQVVPNVAAPQFIYKEKPVVPKLHIALMAIWKAPKHPMLMAKALQGLTVEERSKVYVNWMGGGPLLEEVKDYMAQHVTEVEVNYSGIVYDRLLVAQAMQSADVFVHPTDAENLPCVIIESLCCGTPVLSHAVNGVPELLNAQNGVLLTPGSHTEITQVIRELLQKSRHFNRAQIAKEAGVKFSHEAVGMAYHEIYSRLF